MNEIKIEKGIKILRIKRRNVITYPVEKMEVGDSFFVPYSGRKPSSLQAQLCSNSKSYLRINNHKLRFTTRKQEKGIRIWRIK